MSSFKNAAQAQRRTHRERSQPSHRKKLGFLEKHQDYKKRANDYNRKKTAIKKLRNIAQDKNADEFYRGMIKSKLVDGVHRSDKNNDVSNDVLKLLKTQDANYLLVKLQAEKNKVVKLQQILHGTSESEKANSHTFFVDSDEDVDDFDPDNHILKLEMADEKIPNKRMEKQYAMLKLRQERVKTLDKALNKLQLQRMLSNSKGRVFKTTADDGSAQYKWRKQRLK